MQSDLFKRHRQRVAELMLNNSVMIIFSKFKPDVKKDVDRNYYYLTGNFEFDNIVVLVKAESLREMIFINRYDEEKAKWVGRCKSVAEIQDETGIKEVYYLDEFEGYLESLLLNSNKLYLDLKDEKDPLSYELSKALEWRKKYDGLVVINASNVFKNVRTIKDEEEIAQISKAISITKKGIENILDHLKPAYEYQLESYFDQAIKYHGATGYAFPTIAASGANGCCLHYTANDCEAKGSDLILFDLGCSYEMYCSDISRTFPLSGKFSKRQRQIYDIVLRGQEYVLKHIRAGVTTKELNQHLIDFYEVELKKIGLIDCRQDVAKYYYHGVSHHLGLDCHDLCDYTALKAGSVITCEPGLYIAEEEIGIRIEDDILVTEDGYINLSAAIIKTPEEIESYLAAVKKDK